MLYCYKKNQPKRREVDGPFKGSQWTHDRTYESHEIPADKIDEWFEPVRATGGSPFIDNEQNEIDDAIKKNSGEETPGPDLDDPDEIKI